MYVPLLRSPPPPVLSTQIHFTCTWCDEHVCSTCECSEWREITYQVTNVQVEFAMHTLTNLGRSCELLYSGASSSAWAPNIHLLALVQKDAEVVHIFRKDGEKVVE
uniref:Uncharacterized protein n=1 Tax=Lygus hesperus TaxID=30085 RepID=A0A0A9Y0G9_LYGHE